MPQVAAAAVAAYGAFQGGVTLVAVAKAAVLVGSMAYANRQQKRARGQADRMARAGRGFDIRQTDTVRSLIVGRTSMAPERIVWMQTHGENREFVTFIACFGGHEIDAVEDILLNNESIGSRNVNGWVNDPDSTFVKTERRQKGESITWPSPGNQIQLSTIDIESIISISMADGDQAVHLNPGTHYTMSQDVLSGGTITRLTALSASAAFAGREVVVTSSTKITDPLVRAVAYLGTEAGQRDIYAENLTSQLDDPAQAWTANHLLRGVPHVSFTLKWDVDIFGPTGFPDIRFVVRGARARNWVNGQTTWTNNSARVAAWYLMRPEGFGVSQSQISSTLAIAAQNACDESVPYGPTGSSSQARYTADGAIDPSGSPLDVLRTILGSMAGEAAWVGGQWDLYAGVAQTPVYTLNDDDLAGGSEEFVAEVGIDERVNSVRGRYVGIEDNVYLDRDAPPYASPTYIAQDGGVRSWLEVDLPLTTDVHRAQRIQRLMLHRMRNTATWATTYKLGAYPARAGQWIRCRHSEYGWDELDSGAGKLFQIREHRTEPTGEIPLAMVETSASIFSWNYDEAVEPDPTPNTTFPDPTYVEPVQGLTITSNATTYDEGTDGAKIPYVLLTWDELPPQVAREELRIQIEWKASSEVSYRQERLLPDQTSIKLRPVWGGMLISGSVRVINAIGVRSEPVFLNHSVSADLPGMPATVTSANLLTNPTFKAGVKGWLFGVEAGATNNIYVRKPVQAIIPGTPTQVRIEQAGTENKHAVLSSDLISVIPGRRYCGYAECLGSYAQTRVQCSFYNAAGANINPSLTGTPNIGNMIEAAPAGTSPADPSRYAISSLFVDAPPGAASARFTLVKFGTIGHTSSWGDFYRPFFGEVPAGSTQRPPWDPGGMSSVDTDMLEVGAATDIYTPIVADFSAQWGGLNPPTPASQTIFSFTPSEAGQIEVTVSAEAIGQATSSTPVTLTAWLGGDSWLVKPGQPNPQDNRITVLSVPGNSTEVSSFTVNGTLDAEPGMPTTIVLWVYRSGKPSGAEPPGGPVPKPITSGAAATFNIRGIAARITHVKR